MNEIYDRSDSQGNVLHRGCRLVCRTPSRTKQAMKDECDINNIMLKYQRTGLITHAAARQAYFDDVSEVPNFAVAVQTVRDAESMFMTLPAKLRARFDNDAGKYVEFCSDSSNHDEMIALGLIQVPEVVPPVEVVVRNPSTPPAPEGGV